MLKKIILLILFLECSFVFSIEKPVIKSGFFSTGYFNSDTEYYDIYPKTAYEKLFLSFNEVFSEYFKFFHKFDFYYYNYNNFDEDISHLRSYLFSNQLCLYFYATKINEIILQSKPTLNYYNGETYLELYNYIQYKLKIENFCFKLKYSHLYNSKPEHLFSHNINFCFYWNHYKYDFIKYKTGLSVYLQHYTDIDKKISILKSAVFNFEVAIDFNKIDLENTFDNINYDDTF